MALTTNLRSDTMGIAEGTIGQVVTDAGAAADTSFRLGYEPRYIRWVNVTDRITLEWYQGMAANSALRTVAVGTVTLDVASGITVGTQAVGTGDQFTIKAADIPASKVFRYYAF